MLAGRPRRASALAATVRRASAVGARRSARALPGAAAGQTSPPRSAPASPVVPRPRPCEVTRSMTSHEPLRAGRPALVTGAASSVRRCGWRNDLWHSGRQRGREPPGGTEPAPDRSACRRRRSLGTEAGRRNGKVLTTVRLARLAPSAYSPDGKHVLHRRRTAVRALDTASTMEAALGSPGATDWGRGARRRARRQDAWRCVRFSYWLDDCRRGVQVRMKRRATAKTRIHAR